MDKGFYNILFIPQDGAQIRRIQLSRATARVFSISAGLGVCLIMATVIGLLGTMRSLRERETRLASISAFAEQKEAMEQRLENLRKGLERTQALAVRLEKLAGVEDREGGVAVGPLAEISPLPGKDQPLAAQVDQLLDRALSLEQRVNRFYEVQQDQLTLLASTPSIWPAQGWITSDFGYRRSPTSGRYQFHEGIDIASRWGAPVVVAADGMVVFSGYRSGYGQTVVVDHGFGVETVYCHNSRIWAHKGDRVQRGRKIAQVGRTGSTTGPHLHYEVHVDRIPVDPIKYILR